MQNSILLDLPDSLALVCHDAGASRLIFEWIRADATKQSNATSNWCLLTQGPAVKLWSEYNLPQVRQCQTIHEVLSGAQVLISGTGWASNLEYDSIRAARQLGIKSIAVIDHWTNYRQRFIRNGIEVLPDELWVTDEYAKRLAEHEFKNVKVVQMPNLFLERLVQEVRSNDHQKSVGNNILYLLEPIRDAWGDGVINGEFEALDFFIENIEVLGMNSDLSIRLRPHPSDPMDKYNKWISKQENLKVILDKSPTLAESIMWSDVVVGCQTYAMVVALEAGKQVFSSIPPWAPSCILPQEGIVKISELVQ
jgi:hypothetical protein